MEKCQHRENGEKKKLEIRKPPQFTLISSFTPFYTTILLAPLVITVFFFDFSKPKLYLTEPLSCFFFFPPRIYIYTLLHTTHYTHSGKFFSHFFRSFFFYFFLVYLYLVLIVYCRQRSNLCQDFHRVVLRIVFFFFFWKRSTLVSQRCSKSSFFVVVYVCSLLRLSLSQPPCALFSCSLYIQVYDIREHQPSGTFFFFRLLHRFFCYLVNAYKPSFFFFFCAYR